MNKQDYIEIAQEIGADLYDRGQSPNDLVRDSRAYTWSKDVLNALGLSAAHDALLAGYIAREVEVEEEEEA
jgi:hypothetical protein